MTEGSAERLSGALRHDLRRALRRWTAPAQMRRFAELRRRPVADSDTVSLKPFLDRRAIFVHVPKCAGLTVSKSLFGCRGGAHMSVALYKIAFSAAEYRRFFKFTFVRNPWDRLVSAYHFLRDGGLGESDRAMAACSVDRFASFEAFVKEHIAGGAFADVLHFRTQTSFLRDPDLGRVALDLVGRVETLDADFARIAAVVNPAAALSTTNRGRSRVPDFRRYYDSAMVDIVAAAYRADVEGFGYSFEDRPRAADPRQAR